MNHMGKHGAEDSTAAVTKHRDHLWVLFTIAGCVLAEVWASWVGIGSISGFPVIRGKVPTDWILAVAMEAYWGYALYAWLVAAPGPRSRAMAMWSCAVVFALSLAGQVLYHELTVPPSTSLGRRAVVGFTTSLPVIVLALIAILIHLRYADREAAAETGRRTAEARRIAAEEAAAADERTALRAKAEELSEQLEASMNGRRDEVESVRAALVTDLEAEQDARAHAEQEAEKLTARVEILTRKLDTATARKRRGATGRKRGTATGRKSGPVTGSVTGVVTAPEDMPDEAAPDDLDSEAKVLWYLDKGYSASKAGVFAGLTDSRGRQIARLKKAAPTDTVDGGQKEAPS